MTISSDFSPSSAGPTTTLPSSFEVPDVFPELSTPQERYDHGYKRGYMAGYAEGVRQAQAEMAAEVAAAKAARAAQEARAADLLAKLGSATQQYLQVYGPQEVGLTETAIATAFSLAEAIVARELQARPDRALAVARQALAGLPTGPAIVRAHPDDAGLLEGAANLGNAAQNVTVIADPAMARGGCLVTSGATTVDARLPQALARAREAFCSPASRQSPEAAGPGAGL